MKLLGSYKSNLAPFHYEELLKLLEVAVELGEYSGNKTFNEEAVTLLRSAAQEFGQLPVASAGQRTTDDSMNRPLELLRARFIALKNEAVDFDERAEKLLAVLEKDSVLLDQIIAAAGLESWAQGQIPLTDAAQTKWDYGMGHGSVAAATDILPTHNTTGVEYSSRPPIYTILTGSTGEVHTGLVPPVAISPIGPKDMSWGYTTTGEGEALYGTDWAKLSILEPRPLINFTQDPAVEVKLPLGGQVDNVFEITGLVTGGSLPVFVRVLFHPRRNSTTITPIDAISGGLGTYMPVKPFDKVYVETTIQATAGTDGSMKAELALYKLDQTAILNNDGSTKTVPLIPVAPSTTATPSSGILTIPDIKEVAFARLQFTSIGTTVGTWSQPSKRVHLPVTIATNLSPDETQVYKPDELVYFLNEEFVVDDSGQITMMNVPDGVTLNVRFTEMYPAYECSINEKIWSPPVMMDPNRPYPDDETRFLPIEMTDDSDGNPTRFPITDELGIPTGLSIKLLSFPANEYVLKVTTPADGVNPGATATLTIDMERPGYINSIRLEPFVNFPVRIQSVEIEGFTTDTRNTVYSQGAGLGVLLDKPMRLRFTRQLARKIFIKLYQENYSIKEHEAIPADKLRRDVLASLQSALPNIVRHPQRAVSKRFRGAQYDFGLENIAAEDWIFTTPAVFVAGPFRVTGCPDVIRFDADYQGSVGSYLCFRGFDNSNVIKDLHLDGISISSGSCLVFPWDAALDKTTVVNTDLYLKILFSTEDDLFERFLFQTSNV
jgi:hypothetical protein